MSDTGPRAHGRLRHARRRLADGPALVPAMGVALGYVALRTYWHVVLDQEVDAGRLLGTLTVGTVAGLVLAFVLGRRRRSAPSRMRWVDVSEAVDDGRLPPDADADSWRSLLLRRREIHDQLGGRWAVLVAAVLLVVTVAVGALGGSPLAWTLPAVIAVAVAGMTVIRRGRLARIDALLQPLLDADTTTGPGGRPPT
ncbi:hypothetical protein GW571_09375 [Clavibacter capsici]|uniref:hypothetical protein n=1 Tax=Clavibacter capsici TaxID=1874630 RepID=UPI0014284CD1|nr:hypothetical protein [Clavibacter capsici]QIS42328.1 hypothetical protein GW571_09375 [Clavibacter capsici]